MTDDFPPVEPALQPDAAVGPPDDPDGLTAAQAAVESDLSELADLAELSGELTELTELQVIQAERDDYLDALRRLQADFENFKKRTMKQQTDLLERAAKVLVEKLLHVLDAADLARAHGGGDDVAQIANLLRDTLVKEGLEGVDPVPGDAFDPTVHEAVAHEPGDSGTQEIADLLRPGYRWKGNLLRPAMVKVRG